MYRVNRVHGAVAGGDSQDAYYSQGVGGLWRDGVHRVYRIRRVEGLWREGIGKRLIESTVWRGWRAREFAQFIGFTWW